LKRPPRLRGPFAFGLPTIARSEFPVFTPDFARSGFWPTRATVEAGRRVPRAPDLCVRVIDSRAAERARLVRGAAVQHAVAAGVVRALRRWSRADSAPHHRQQRRISHSPSTALYLRGIPSLCSDSRSVHELSPTQPARPSQLGTLGVWPCANAPLRLGA